MVALLARAVYITAHDEHESIAMSDLKLVLREAEKLGFTTSKAGKRNVHLKFEKPGCPAVFFSATPSDHRAIKNGIAKLRRAARENHEQASV